jgi:hypothetical protein
VTHATPSVLQITRLPVGRRASGFVQVAKGLIIRRGHARIALFEWGDDLQGFVGPAGSANVLKRPFSGVGGATGPIHGLEGFRFHLVNRCGLALARGQAQRNVVLVSKR